MLGEEEFQAVVRDKRDDLMTRIRDLVNEQARDFGIEIVDVRIRRADLPEANSQAIYRRMQTEREQEAAEFRARGQEVSRAIRAQADKQVTVLLAEATRDSEIIRGQGDGCRNRVFAKSSGKTRTFSPFTGQCRPMSARWKMKARPWCCRPTVRFSSFCATRTACWQTAGRVRSNAANGSISTG